MREYGHKRSFFAMRMVFSAVLLAICLVVLPQNAWSAEQVGKITNVEGKVDILRGGQLPAVAVNLDDAIYVKDVLRTKSGAKAEITFDDGNVVKVAPSSRIDIEDYVPHEGKNKAVIKMPRGKVQAIVNKDIIKKLSLSSKASAFEVHTPNAVAGVRGTDFFTMQTVVQGINITNIVVKDGIVETHNPKFPDQVVRLTPGTATSILENKPPAAPVKVPEQGMKNLEKDTTLKEKPKQKTEAQPAKDTAKAPEAGKPGDKPKPGGPAPAPGTAMRPGGPAPAPGTAMRPGGPAPAPGTAMGPGGPAPAPGMMGPGGPMSGPAGMPPVGPMGSPTGPMGVPTGPIGAPMMPGAMGPMAGPTPGMMGPDPMMGGAPGMPMAPGMPGIPGMMPGAMGPMAGPTPGMMGPDPMMGGAPGMPIAPGMPGIPGMMPGAMGPMAGPGSMDFGVPAGMVPGMMPGAMGPMAGLGGMDFGMPAGMAPGMMPGAMGPMGSPMPGMMPGAMIPGMYMDPIMTMIPGLMPGMMPGTYPPTVGTSYPIGGAYPPIITTIFTDYNTSVIYGTTTTNFYGSMSSNSNYDFVTASAFPISGTLSGSATTITTGITNELSGPISFTISPYSNPTGKKLWAADMTGTTDRGGAFVGFVGSTAPASPGKGGYVAFYAEGGMLGIIEGTFTDYLDASGTIVNAGGTGRVHLIGPGITFLPTVAGLQSAMSSTSRVTTGSDYGFKIGAANDFLILLGDPTNSSSVSFKEFETILGTYGSTAGIRMRFETGTFSLTDYVSGRNGVINTSVYMGDRTATRYSVGLASISNDPVYGLLSANYDATSIEFNLGMGFYSLGREGVRFNAKYSGGSYNSIELGGFQGSPMSFANSVSATAYYNGTSEGTLSAFMGGTSPLWYGPNMSGSGNITIIGTTTGLTPGVGAIPSTRTGQIWKAGISSAVINSGAYDGYISGITRYNVPGGITPGVDDYVEGLIAALYISPYGDAGIMTGSFGVPGTVSKGQLYPDIAMFEADGRLNTVPMATTGNSASILTSSLIKSADFNYQTMGGGFWDPSYNVTGSFTSSSSGTHSIKWISDGAGGAVGNMGVWRTDDYGSYSNPGGYNYGWVRDLTGWNTASGGYAIGALMEGGPFGYKSAVSYTVSGPVYTTIATGNRLDAQFYGYWADSGTRSAVLSTPMTAIMTGNVVGTFDPVAYTYQAAVSGAWVETTKLLQMVCGDSTCSGFGTPNPNVGTLNIPSFIVGKVNLAGSGTNMPTVNMNNVVFLAPAAGSAPKIWATADVNGTYSANPVGQTANLSGGGINVQFTPQQWTSNKWLATVDGSIPASTMNNSSALTVKGAAAGTYTGAGSGSFNGTAAGTLKK
ncbi:MAG: hypothetical protein EPN22_01640 [Nitrospirae bacterium]|nr:MAG: hypothetical protein EPN22_01640 [Nitrospirota bacterium]